MSDYRKLKDLLKRINCKLNSAKKMADSIGCDTTAHREMLIAQTHIDMALSALKLNKGETK